MTEIKPGQLWRLDNGTISMMFIVLSVDQSSGMMISYEVWSDGTVEVDGVNHAEFLQYSPDDIYTLLEDVP